MLAKAISVSGVDSGFTSTTTPPRLFGQERQGGGRVHQPARTHDQADFRGLRAFRRLAQDLGIEPFSKPHHVRP